ncbi:MAG: transposase [Novosphingobium sp.]|nr:transposase [Novosphingobium sp.]
MTLDLSPPGKPIENASVKAFNSEPRSKCMETHRFLSIADARAKIEKGTGTIARIGRAVALATRPRSYGRLSATQPARHSKQGLEPLARGWPENGLGSAKRKMARGRTH